MRTEVVRLVVFAIIAALSGGVCATTIENLPEKRKPSLKQCVFIGVTFIIFVVAVADAFNTAVSVGSQL